MFNDKTNMAKEHEFRISGDDVSDVFSIDKVTGDVYALKPVDRETKALYHVS